MGEKMSNMTRLKVEIKDVNQRVLREALIMLAKHYGLELSENSWILNYYREKFKRCQFVLRGRTLPLGMGFDVIGNSLEITGDRDPMVQPLFQEIERQIKQYYVAAQHLLALKAMGYASKVEKQGQKLVIMAVR